MSADHDLAIRSKGRGNTVEQAKLGLDHTPLPADAEEVRGETGRRRGPGVGTDIGRVPAANLRERVPAGDEDDRARH